ncbi:MAG: UDP-N-acetylmuramate dehydrogenase [Pseudomonadota bacterium]
MSIPYLKYSVPLSAHTTFKIGGPATAVFEANSAASVIESTWKAKGMGLLWQVIGHGSNILASDQGYDGAIIVFKDEIPPHDDENGTITVSGGYTLKKLIDFMAEKGKGGLENLYGIPGTVGGAIAGNAGAYGSQIADSISSVLIMDRAGNVRKVKRDELEFAYRWSSIKEAGHVVLEATFRTDEKDPTELKRTIDERLADRKRKHPDPKGTNTAGSFFKNPLGQDGKRISAGKLLEEAGCKELRVGGARLWHTHANIIVADENATAADVRKLANTMATRVSEKYGINLLPEVCYLE